MAAGAIYTYRATLPYGGITRIRFRGSFSPRGNVHYIKHCAEGTPNV